MTFSHSVSPSDLKTTHDAVTDIGQRITGKLKEIGGSLETEFYVGTRAEEFAIELDKINDDFVEVQTNNLANIMETVAANMSVVSGKLGGGTFTAEPLQKLATVGAKSMQAEEEGHQAIDVNSLGHYGQQLAGWMTDIGNMFNEIEGAIEKNGWIGPEKEATVADVGQQIRNKVVTSIDSSGQLMQAKIQDQINEMSTTG